MKLAIFASYNASVLEPILAEGFEVALIITNNQNASVIERAKKLGIPCAVINEKRFSDVSQAMLEYLERYGIDYIVLAGYMKFIDPKIIQAYPRRIINSHPSLLPKFGGKGMYGRYVHEAVLKAGERESGVSVHYVDEVYDNGEIILQKKLFIDPSWEVEDLERAVKKLEKEAIVEVLKSL